jgi:hypothetical protein
VKMEAHDAPLLKDTNSEVASMFPQLRTMSEKRNYKQTQKFRKSRGSGIESDGSSSDNVKRS